MLETLRIKNLAIFKEAEFNLSDGLVVLTGQTGAGKSITLKALELISGARGSSELIRSGAESAEVEALFILEDWAKEKLIADFEDISESLDGDELIIRRVIKHSGRGKIYINGSLKTRAELEHLTPLILDITAQHYQQTLLNSKNHRELLDSFGIDEKQAAKVKELYSVWKTAKERAENFFKETSEKEEYLRRLQFEYEELNSLSLEAGEKENLESELSREENVEFLKASASEGLDLLDDSQGGLIRKLLSLRNKLEESSKLDPSFKEALSLIQSSELQLVEAVRELEEKSAGLSLDPQSLEKKRVRLSVLLSVLIPKKQIS